jgi:predicted ATPase
VVFPAEFARASLPQGGGNPFFIEEVTKSLLETGALLLTADGLVLGGPVAEIAIPDTIQDVIMARIDRLGEAPKRAIQIASVIGREFAVRLLQRASDLGVNVDRLVGELRALELIYEKSGVPELAYMFKHALTHDVAYGSLLGQRRRELHRLIGFATEELYAGRLRESGRRSRTSSIAPRTGRPPSRTSSRPPIRRARRSPTARQSTSMPTLSRLRRTSR